MRPGGRTGVDGGECLWGERWEPRGARRVVHSNAFIPTRPRAVSMRASAPHCAESSERRFETCVAGGPTPSNSSSCQLALPVTCHERSRKGSVGCAASPSIAASTSPKSATLEVLACAANVQTATAARSSASADAPSRSASWNAAHNWRASASAASQSGCAALCSPTRVAFSGATTRARRASSSCASAAAAEATSSSRAARVNRHAWGARPAHSTATTPAVSLGPESRG